jgi:heat shock protein HslJ
MSGLRTIAMMLVMGTIAQAAVSASAQEGLVGAYWKAVELAGTPVASLAANREVHLVFEAGGRFSGSDGCNRLSGAYTLKGEGVAFGQAAATQMGCPDTADVERRFRSVLKGTSHWRVAGDRLELFGATGKPLAVFERGARPARPAGSSPLEGTAWQLARFQGGDGKTLTPDDPAKYTVEFAIGGRLTARIDCNRGSGTWNSTATNQLELGPLALTRAMCPEGSLHDQIVKQWTFVRSFTIKDRRLFLALMADGGTYEFAPRVSKQ